LKTALLLGIGGLGCPAALALSELSPLVRLVLVDPDRVERSNLPRQILFTEAEVGQFKAVAAARKLPNAQARAVRFDEFTADALLQGVDVVLDGTDDAGTRFLVNDECVRRGIPLVHGAALGWAGQLFTVTAGSACLRCLFESPPQEGPTCAQAGVLAALCGLVGAEMARAAILVLQGVPEVGILQRWDARRGTARPFHFSRDPRCPACIQAPIGESNMPVTIKIPAPLRPLTANLAEIAVENAATVQGALEELSRKYPGLKDKLLDDKGALRRYVNLFKNDEDVRSGQGLATALKEGDRLTIVPAIAGGWS
jgi:molybdopterin/thiamine biosynthesis adenylyltransferase/molybdopterin converting factor small subunit